MAGFNEPGVVQHQKSEDGMSMLETGRRTMPSPGVSLGGAV